MSAGRIYGIIPARLQSTRLPGKLLLDDTGKPLIQHTWEAVQQAKCLHRVLIATDSEEIAAVVRGFGAHCEMTGDHPSGTDRIAEVAKHSCQDAGVILNIQGDEPEIDATSIDGLAQSIIDTPDADMATLATPIRHWDMLSDTSCTKVVCAADGRALYFSRSQIPHCRDEDPKSLVQSDSPWLLHVGVYAYRRDYLLQLAEMPPSRLEQLEKLEQLRALEDGARIQVALVDHHVSGIDTPEDYAQFVTRQARQAA